MNTTMNLYVGKTTKPYFDQILACSKMNKESVSSIIGRAMKYYQQDLNGEIPLIADKKYWKKAINNMSISDAIEMNTLICKLNIMLMEKCKTQK